MVFNVMNQIIDERFFRNILFGGQKCMVLVILRPIWGVMVVIMWSIMLGISCFILIFHSFFFSLNSPSFSVFPPEAPSREQNKSSKERRKIFYHLLRPEFVRYC